MSENETQVENGFWAIVELMGHVRMAGYVTEEEKFGVKLGRIDLPAGDGEEPVTLWFGGQSVYRVTPVGENLARAIAWESRPRPVHHYELRQLEGAVGEPGDEWEDEEREDREVPF